MNEQTIHHQNVDGGDRHADAADYESRVLFVYHLWHFLVDQNIYVGAGSNHYYLLYA